MRRLTVAPHADRVPVAAEADARRLARHLQVERALDERRLDVEDRRGGIVVGRIGRGDEELAPVHPVAAVDLVGRGAEAPAADAEHLVGLAFLNRLAVRLAVEDALFRDLAEMTRPQFLVSGALCGVHLVRVRHLAHQQHGQAVHVEGERGRGVALRQLLRDQAVGLQVGAEAAAGLGHAEPQEAGLAQVVVVLDGEARLAVERRGARREALEGEPAGLIDQLLLPCRRPHVHVRLPDPEDGPQAKAGSPLEMVMRCISRR
jgi:hypothetical protein